MNVIRFIKNWTLPVSMAIGALLYLLFAFVPALNGAATFFGMLFNGILPLFMFFILFVTFCKVDFRKLVPVKWNFWISVFQITFVWILVGIILVFRLRGNQLTLVEAILTCIIGPCAAAAPVVTAKLGGRLEEITTYTFLSNFICAILIPICFPLIEKAAHISFFSAFLCILYQVCIVLVLPMGLAFFVKHFPPLHLFHQWIISVKDLSYYMWGCSLMIVTGTTVRNIVHANTSLVFLLMIAFLGLLLCIIQFSVGRYVGHFFHRTVEAGQALGQKNTTFAIWIAYTYLTPLASVGPGCYILWQNIINSVEIWRKRKAGELKSV